MLAGKAIVDEEIAQGVDGMVVNAQMFESIVLFVFLVKRNKVKDRKNSPPTDIFLSG
jgi:hypothetical protein